MELVQVPENRRLVWYLALEEYLAERVKEEQVFFWIVAPTVIFGRHQVMINEVNVPFCRERGIAMYRRKSGGGCVYADSGNLMISYITPDTHAEKVFQRYLDLLAEALHKAGYPAVKSEHNDVLVGDRKVSGNACYALPTGTIVHGTLLWNVDFETLQQAITPTKEKLQKHGVESVRQRVANLADLPATEPIHSIHDMQRYLAACLTTNRGFPEKSADFWGPPNDQRLTGASPKNLPIFGVPLTTNDIQAVDRIEQTYLDPEFIEN